MKRVVIESPYKATSKNPITAFFQRRANRAYARACVRDSLQRGEAPIASHLLYTQPGILRDHNGYERQWGIDAGLTWAVAAELTAVYIDRGISSGMYYGINKAQRAGRPVEQRSLYEKKQ
jgi:hypothetical protein